MQALSGLADPFSDLMVLVAQHPDALSKTYTILKKVLPHVDVVYYVVEDPSFPLVMDRIKTLHQMELPPQGASKSTSPQSALDKAKLGVGMRSAVKGLDTFIYVRRNPAVVPAAIGGVAFLLLGLGFVFGRVRRRVVTG